MTFRTPCGAPGFPVGNGTGAPPLPPAIGPATSGNATDAPEGVLGMVTTAATICAPPRAISSAEPAAVDPPPVFPATGTAPPALGCGASGLCVTPPGSCVSNALFPVPDEGTNITNAVTPAAPTPLSTAELVSADRSVDLRRRVAPAARGRAAGCGLRTP